MTKATVLVIEDDRGIRNFLRLSLEEAGYRVLLCENALTGIETYYRETPAAILLDLGLADLDGNAVIMQIRADGNTPIIVVSARQTEDDKIRALDLGANDYLTKPFSVRELLARLRAALRVSPYDGEKSDTNFSGDVFEVDTRSRNVTVRGEQVHLTPTEYKILLVLIENQGMVLTHQLLQERIWGYFDDATAVTLRVHIRALRAKLQTSLIVTEVGVGYRLLRAAEPQ